MSFKQRENVYSKDEPAGLHELGAMALIVSALVVVLIVPVLRATRPGR